MGSLSNYAENKILDHLTGKTSYTIPTTTIQFKNTTTIGQFKIITTQINMKNPQTNIKGE